MVSPNSIAAATLTVANKSNLGMDPRFITKRKNYYEMQELEAVKIDRTHLNLYPSIGAKATDAKKTYF